VNSVIELETEFPPDELLKRLKAIEKAMGRKRVKGSAGIRVIDSTSALRSGDRREAESQSSAPECTSAASFFCARRARPARRAPHLGQSVSALLATVKDEKRVTLLPRA